MNRIANLYCTACSEIFCNDCLEAHVEKLDIKHNVVNYKDYTEQTEEKKKEKAMTMKTTTGFLKEHLLEANILVEKQFAEAMALLIQKKNFLEQIIDSIYDKKIEEIPQEFKDSKLELENMLTDHSLSNLCSDLTPNDLEKMVFFEQIIPAQTRELEINLQKELNYNIEFFPTGKPLPLYSFKSNSSIIYQFDVLTEEEVTVTVKNFECKAYAGWCLANSLIVYTGGWVKGHSSYETFEINTVHWTIEPRPNLNVSRHQHAAIYLNGAVYVFSGISNDQLTTVCEKWDGADSWKKISAVHSAKAQMGICAVGNHIYLSGESSIERYNTITDTYENLPITFNNKLLSVLIGIENKILIFRGSEVIQVETSNELTHFKLTEIENINLWSTTQPIFKFNKVYFIIDGLRTVYSFDISEKQLELITDMNHPELSQDIFDYGY